jgi:hypothetical protein
MPISIVEKPTGRADVVVLAEDAGLGKLLEGVLPETIEVEVVRGGGWPQIYSKYEDLRGLGVDEAKIMPVLDADTLGNKGPATSMDENPNVFRFYRDLEFAFAISPDLFLAHALLAESDQFGPRKAPGSLNAWVEVVNAGRLIAIERKLSTLSGIDIAVRDRLTTSSRDPSMFRMPSKVVLSERLGQISKAGGTLPHEVEQLVSRLLKVAGSETSSREVPTSLDEEAIRAMGLSGQIVVSSARTHVYLIGLNPPTIRRLTELGGVKRAGWSRDGKRIAGTLLEREGKGWRAQVTILRFGDQKARPIPLGTNASFRCWSADSQRVLARVPSSGVMFLDFDPKKRTKCEPDMSWWRHCISSKGTVARALWHHEHSKPIQILKQACSESLMCEVPGVMDATYGLAWSNTGDRLAFINRDGQGRSSVCVWRHGEHETRFLTPWLRGIRWVTWSPDGAFLLFCRTNDLCVVSSSADHDPIPTVTKIASIAEPVLACCAWRAADVGDNGGPF